MLNCICENLFLSIVKFKFIENAAATKDVWMVAKYDFDLLAFLYQIPRAQSMPAILNWTSIKFFIDIWYYFYDNWQITFCSWEKNLRKPIYFQI